MKKIIVIGAGAAGAKAASKAKRINRDNYVELYTNEDIIAFSLCGLPYYIEGCVKDVNKLIVRTPQDFINMGIQVYLNHELQEIYPEKNCVLINGNQIFYDELILALGGKVFMPNIENIGAKNVFTLRTIKSGVKIREKMLESKSVLIVGAGYIAIELAEAFVANGLNVIIIERNSRIAVDFDDDFSKIIQEVLEKKSQDKLKTYYNETITKFNVDFDNNFVGAVCESGLEVQADFCVLATGSVPNVEVARKSGIKLGSTGAILTDSRMRTNYKNIYACGDCTQEQSLITHLPMYIGLGSIANKEGRVAAINAASIDDYEAFDGILGSIITRYFDYSISKTGLSYNYAMELSKTLSIEPIFATVTKKDKAGYMPQAGEISIKIVADKRNGELLGAQAVGCQSNTLQRINTITTALKSRSTVDDILHLDLPYAPPFSGSIDPILTAAYKLKEQMKS